MSVECLVDRSQLRGLPYETAKLYGMPCIGARYTADDVRKYRRDPLAPCAICGALSNSTHHEPPRGATKAKHDGKVYPGSFLLCTPMGKFVLKPALFAMCGDGTRGCHGMRTENGLRIRWEWDSDEEERRWWDGWYLSHGYAPHDERLFRHGRYVIEMGDMAWEVRR